MSDDSDELLRDLAWAMGKTAQQHAAHTRYWLQTVPGLGQSLRLVLLYERPDIARFPRGQDCVSYGRVVKCAQAAAGKRAGPAGTKIGHAYLQGAFSAAAGWCLRHNPVGHKSLTRFEPKQGQGKALTVWAHQRARAV